MKCCLSIFSIVLILLSAGCHYSPIQQNYNPTTIVIRNNSGTDIEEVSLRSAKKQNRYVRMGAISPLPDGVSQTVGRQSDPPRLQNTLTICWKIGGREETCRPVDLKKALQNDSSPGNALVFEILEGFSVKVYRAEL